MEELPDDVLVLVMQYLSVADILACRLACKRFGGPSVYGQVWRHRRAVDAPCVCAVLRLAPCLEAVLCSGHTSTLAATQCAVAELILVVDWQVNPAKYAQVVRSQEAFGRLKRVVVRYDGPYRAFAHGADADTLLTALVQSSHLESLVLTGDAARDAVFVRGPFKQGPSGSSLKIFKCALTRNSEYVVNTLLAGHAATLEEVELDGGCDCAPNTARSLASLPKLQRLKCDMIPALEAVAACKTLRDVTLSVTSEYYDGEINVGCAEGFLRQANQLHTFAMDFTVIQTEDCDRLIEALASSGGSLERLSATVISDFEELRALIRALPGLPALRQLTITLDKDEKLLYDRDLLKITSATAPALRRLELLANPPRDPEDCHHYWLHGEDDGKGIAVRILASNPLLHIHLPKPSACEYCLDCERGCHQRAEWNEHSRLVLFAHDPDHCPSPEDHTADSTWTCIRIPCSSD